MGLGFIAWLAVGLLAGFLAGQVWRGQGFGLIGNVVVGLVGSMVGGWLFELFNVSLPLGPFWGSLATSVIGALALLFVWNLVFKGGKRG